MIEIYSNKILFKQNSYLIAPFRKSIDLIVEKRTSDNIFQDILDLLLSYFSEIKEHRTIMDVDNAFKKIDDYLNLNNLEDIEEKVIAEESEELRGELKDFIANNIENISLSMNNAKTGFMLNYWISNLEIAFEVFENSLKEFRRKNRFLLVKSSRVKDFLKKKLDVIHKALFLVFFRVMEQIYMVSEDKKFIPNDEINYLIEDVVYLENIARATHENF